MADASDDGQTPRLVDSVDDAIRPYADGIEIFVLSFEIFTGVGIPRDCREGKQDTLTIFLRNAGERFLRACLEHDEKRHKPGLLYRRGRTLLWRKALQG